MLHASRSRNGLPLVGLLLLAPSTAMATANLSGATDEVMAFQIGWAHWAPTIPQAITSGSLSTSSYVYVTDDDRLSTAPNAAEIVRWDGDGYNATLYGTDSDPTDFGPRGIAISSGGDLYFSVAERDGETAGGFDGDCIAKWTSTGSQACIAEATNADPGDMDTTQGSTNWGNHSGTEDGLYWIQDDGSGDRVLYRLIDSGGLVGSEVTAVPDGLTAFTFDASDRLYFATSTDAGGSANGIYRMTSPTASVETIITSSGGSPVPLEDLTDLVVGTLSSGTEFNENVLYFSLVDPDGGTFRSEVHRIRNFMDDNPEVEVVLENLRTTVALAMRDGQLLISETSGTTGGIREVTAAWEGHFEDTWEGVSTAGENWGATLNSSALSLESTSPIQGGKSYVVEVDGTNGDDTDNAYVLEAIGTGVDDTAALVQFRLDPNSVAIASGDAILLFLAFNDSNANFGIGMVPDGSGYDLVGIIYNDSGTPSYSSAISIADEPTDIELIWHRSVGGGTNNGSLELRDLGAPSTVVVVSPVDNDTLDLTGWILGAAGMNDTGTQGDLLFDGFRIYEPND